MLKNFKIGMVLCSLALGACSSSGGGGNDQRALSDYDDERQRLYDTYQNETLTLVSDVPDRGLGVYDGVGVIDVTSNGDRVLRAIGDARVEYDFGNAQIDGTVNRIVASDGERIGGGISFKGNESGRVYTTFDGTLNGDLEVKGTNVSLLGTMNGGALGEDANAVALYSEPTVFADGDLPGTTFGDKLDATVAVLAER